MRKQNKKNKRKDKIKKAVNTGLASNEVQVVEKAVAPNQIRTEEIDVDKMVRKQVARRTAFSQQSALFGTVDKQKGLQSLFYDPLQMNTNAWGRVRTLSPYYGRQISYRILRRVSEKAWVLNLCISNLIRKVRPFLKVSTDENTRGFRIIAKSAKDKKEGMNERERKTAEVLADFMLKTGDIQDNNREDDLDAYASKIIRDICQLDQISTELQRTRSGELGAFWAVDPATIEMSLPQSEEETGIKYVQVINNIPYAFYSRSDFIFTCMNPRTDVERSGYGYSIVEQAIDLITSSINTFMFNAGFFVENKLPRGMLLLNGDADLDEVEEIEDYIVNLMSGAPSSQWRVPIIPSGKSAGGESNRRFEWINLQGSNKDMEFQSWFDLQLSGIVGLFGFSMEDLGLHSQKSAPLIGADVSPKLEASKSLVLGDMLSFLQKHLNKILQEKNPDYEFEFVGYEKSDSRLVLEIDRSEVETFKTIDEKRIEKGLEPFNESWSTVPLNPQVVQILQSEKQQDAGGMFGGMGGIIDDEEHNEGDDEQNEGDNDGQQANSEIEQAEQDAPHGGDKNNNENKQWNNLSKSFGIKREAIRIAI
ncbi:phage portal protein [Treponema phagedenis]|uniref:phage portal protein n=1 Tax=Treponema phagedenis TaxID=162 RepID=UPI0011E753AB|nr:phage portal protein [Treponema phagedenis]QEJ94645.1 phage portal protein [Treponema phagedenis]QEK06595.1 phage portal protein [Treponema phagedenis]